MSAGRQRFANQHRQARSLGSHRSQQSRQVHAAGAGRREFQKPDPFEAMTRLRRLYHPKRATIHRRHWRTQARPRHLTAIRRLAMPPLGNADAGLGTASRSHPPRARCYGCVQRRCARAPPVSGLGLSAHPAKFTASRWFTLTSKLRAQERQLQTPTSPG